MEHQPALLQWVLIDDEMQHVSSYAHLKPKQRPKAICPACEKPVIMKLGTQKVHHVAHTPGSDCVLTNPESALHYNCKMHVARQLEKSTFLKIMETCTSCYKSEQDIIWQANWDEIKVERKLSDGLQPDVALWKNKQPIAAIEIFVTHAVDSEKSSRLKALGVPWIEIRGQPSLYSEESAWQAETPIPADRRSWKSTWQCFKCEEAARQRVASRRWERLNGEKPICFKLLDWYWPSGRWLRCLFTINKVLKDGQISEYNLSWVTTPMNYRSNKSSEENGFKFKSISADHSKQEAIKKLQAEGRNYLNRKRKQQKLRFDSPMPWVYGNPDHIIYYDKKKFPRHLFFNRETREWFMPKDRENELWYRSDGTRVYGGRKLWHR